MTKNIAMEFKKILLILFLAFAIKLQSQSYSLSVTTETYTDLSESTSLNNGATWDDPEYTIPIGFNFQYFNSVINTIQISEIGYGAFLTTNNNTTGIIPLLTPYDVDIIDRAYLNLLLGEQPTGSLSNISYKLEGAVGNRVLKIEWNNVGFYNDIDQYGTSTSFTNFQLWLFENNSGIEIHFGPNSITEPNLVFGGNTGASIFLMEGYDFDISEIDSNAFGLTGNSSNPTLETLNTNIDIGNSFLDGIIPNGTVYKFTNSNLSIDDFENNLEVKLFPNPSSDYIKISGIKQKMNYEIYNSLGSKIMQGLMDENTKLNIKTLANGLYFLKLKNGNTLKFLKK